LHGVSRRKEGTAWGEGGYCLGRGRVLPGVREGTAWGKGGYCLGRGRVLPGEREGAAWGEGLLPPLSAVLTFFPSCAAFPSLHTV